MANIVTVYCEGTAGSLDYHLLEKTLVGLPTGWQIEPIGGKHSVWPLIQVYESTAAWKSTFYLFFGDRDYDYPVPDTERLTIDRYKYISYRTTIENYLISESIFLDFTKHANLTAIQNLADEDILVKYRNTIKSLRYHQAMRHALGERTREVKPRLHLHANIIGTSSGHLPNELSQDACRLAGKNQIESDSALINAWNVDRFNERFDCYVNLFDDSFSSSNQYLYWYQGKDILSALRREFDFNIDGYTGYAKKHFDYTQFQDLVELRTLVEDNL